MAEEKDQNDLRGANGEFEKEINDFETWLNKRKANTLQASKLHEPGFNNSSKDSEWEEIATYWDQELSEGMEQFFDDYVHDSRAWFKLTGTEADDVEGVLQEWVRIKNQFQESPPLDGFERNPLTPEQLKYAAEYEKTKRVPRMPTGGREFLNGAGYLRYRRIYAGANSMLISRNQPTEKVQVAKHSASRNELSVSA